MIICLEICTQIHKPKIYFIRAKWIILTLSVGTYRLGKHLNSVDWDQMLQSVADQGAHCLPLSQQFSGSSTCSEMDLLKFYNNNGVELSQYF